MRPLKFNKCPSNLERESEQTCERTRLTSNLCYVRDATDPSGMRGARRWRNQWWEREGRSGRTLREWWGSERAAASGRFGWRRSRPGFWFLPRPPKRCQRVRRPAAQQACALSRFFVPFLAYQKHESDRPRIYPWCSTARRYNAVRISSAKIRAALALARVPPRHTAQPSGK